MKRKLLSIAAIAMAMAMTTSAFAAPAAKGSGDVDGDGATTSNDVFKIISGQADDSAEADYDGDSSVTGLDGDILYYSIMQPKAVKEGLTLRAATRTIKMGLLSDSSDETKLGAVLKEEDNGMMTVTDEISTDTTVTIRDAINEMMDLVDMATDAQISTVTNRISGLYFNDSVKGTVYINSEDGWSVLCNALRYIVPMDEATAAVCGRTENANYDGTTNSDRYNALMAIKKYIVGNDQAPDATVDTSLRHTITLDAAAIKDIKDQLYIAIPNGLSVENEIKPTIKEVLSITDTRFTFAVEYGNGKTETLSHETSDSSEFVNALAELLSGYGEKNLGDFRNALGDKLSIENAKTGAGATLEFVKRADFNYDNLQ